MTATSAPPIYYPSGDGQPVAETFNHLYVILITISHYFDTTCVTNRLVYWESITCTMHRDCRDCGVLRM